MMKFINLLGKTRILINIQNISFIEETKGGCKVHFNGGTESITTDCSYDEMMSGIKQILEG